MNSNSEGEYKERKDKESEGKNSYYIGNPVHIEIDSGYTYEEKEDDWAY